MKGLSLTAVFPATYEHQVGGYRSDASLQPSIFGLMMNGSANLLNAVSDGKITASEIIIRGWGV
jgi:hypothetical protein